ncbi:MAG: fused MFS/spermidine synthase [Candidatus Eisenbacteria bacterium]|uniref:Fused MFS/spermidine synthase n=1 Tax=Eiseniibacteriota bacterium TaxID=2212470 RepID=A0A7Y2EEF2_UNCEI|nr:fused MFS/spermidine synthase [Candidatus Eisenbacteria bacterium]
MRHAALYLIVFSGGASVLAIEILGTRILGPFYGVSLFLWSALITITLAALSVGYVLGGRLADKGPSFRGLAWPLLGAGLWTLALPWLKYPLLGATESFGLRGAVLATSMVLFFPPLTLLGMISPYAIRLKAVKLTEVGRTAGDIYAISTVASVVAALLTGFYLIPNFGVFRLTLGIGFFLLLISFIAFASDKAKFATAASLVLVLVSGWGFATASPERVRTDENLLAIEQSPYAELRVVEWEDNRVLLIDGGGHTVVEPGTWKTLYPYAVVMDLNKHFFDGPGDMLLLGLGGGSVAKSYYKSGWEVDVVEIDAAITRIAKKYFGLEDKEATVYHEDARQYLVTHEKQYDLIIMDAFGSSSIPFHIVTKEAFALVKSRLKPGGVLAINYEAVGWLDVITRSLTATVGVHFKNVTTLPLAEPPDNLGNLVLLASDRALEFDEGEHLVRPRLVMDDAYAHWMAMTRNHAWDNRFTAERGDAPILTDDLNPSSLWAERINLVARRVLHDSFEWSHLSW